MDGEIPHGSGGESRQNGPETPAGFSERYHAQGDEGNCRIHKCNDPKDQGKSLRFQKQGSVPDCHPIPQGGLVNIADGSLHRLTHTRPGSPKTVNP